MKRVRFYLALPVMLIAALLVKIADFVADGEFTIEPLE